MAIVFVFIILTFNLSEAFDVVREIQDTFHMRNCWTVSSFVTIGSECKCFKHLPTYSSKESGERACISADSLECKILPGVKLISNALQTFDAPALVADECEIDDIMLWNIPTESLNELGVWADVTAIASHHVYVNKSGVIPQLELKLPTDIWAGQLIKITFDCEDACALFKVQGRISYPFDITSLIPTTQKPITIIEKKEVVHPENPILYIILGLAVAIVIILLIIVYIFRHKLPCYNRSTEKEEDLHQPIYAEPNNFDVAPNSYETIMKQSKDEAYYIELDTLPNSENNHSVQASETCVANPVYMDTSPNMIELYEVSEDSPHYCELEKDPEQIENKYENIKLG